MTVQQNPRRRAGGFGVGSIIGFLLFALALYWLAILFGLLPEKPQLVALTFVLILVFSGAGSLGVLD